MPINNRDIRFFVVLVRTLSHSVHSKTTAHFENRKSWSPPGYTYLGLLFLLEAKHKNTALYPNIQGGSHVVFRHAHHDAWQYLMSCSSRRALSLESAIAL
jgi:hypothetical protein